MINLVMKIQNCNLIFVTDAQTDRRKDGYCALLFERMHIHQGSALEFHAKYFVLNATEHDFMLNNYYAQQ